LRHAQSARLLTQILAIGDPLEDERLNNIDYGTFKGRPVKETPQMADSPNVAYEGGECWNDVAAKWGKFCREELVKHNRGIVLLAGQSATAVRMLRHICDHIPLKETLSEEVPNIPFFSNEIDFSTKNLVWRYTWATD
jgi:broad specificity phosphatase PhoE